MVRGALRSHRARLVSFSLWARKAYGPTRPITTIKTAWANVRERAGVSGRLHDSRHTLITELADSGVGDQTIMDIASHVSRQMLKHNSHIRMQAKREVFEGVGKKQQEAKKDKKAEDAKRAQDCSSQSRILRVSEGSPFKNPYNWVFLTFRWISCKNWLLR